MIRLSLLFIFLSSSLFSQTNEYLLFFSNKLQTESTLEEKDFYDIPVNPMYLLNLKEEGEILNVSKWLNGVHYKTQLPQEEIQLKFPFVNQLIPLFPQQKGKSFLLQANEIRSTGDTNTYRHSFSQLEMTKTISCLHDNGYNGNNVTIAVLDAGFPMMDTMLAFRKMRQEGRIVDTWDFEDNASQVYHKHTHGTYVTSILGAELDSTFIGSAPKANYAFYITEIGRFEKNIEEFNLVLGLERADSIGADICSISLGYRNFDTLQVSYGYAGMDGQTTIVAQGVSIAKNKGMIISVAAGNSGSGAGTLSSPCDADSILCVGAIKLDSTRAGFSSEGPTFDGRTKPDVVTIGEGCAFVGLDDSVRWGNGTSFATPLMSGLVACIKQAHPLRTNFQIMDAIRNNADRASSPDNIYGWGIPDGCKIDSALRYLDSVILGNSEQLQAKIDVSVHPNPTSDFVTISTKELLSSISVYSTSGKRLLKKKINNASLKYMVSLENMDTGVYFIQLITQDGKLVSKKIIKK